MTALASAFAIAASHALAQPKGHDKWGWSMPEVRAPRRRRSTAAGSRPPGAIA